MRGKPNTTNPGTCSRKNTKKDMTTKQAAEILKKYNEWRREKHVPCDPPPAKLIGEAIDYAVGIMESLSVGADIESIIKAVTRLTGVTEEKMCGRGRHREYAEARAIVSYLAYNNAQMTLTAIGERLGRTHSAVMHYNEMVSGWLEEPRRNPRGARITTQLIEEIGQ